MPQTLTPADLVREVFAATDRQDVDANAALMHDDVELRFGNNDPVVGKAAFIEMSHGFHASLASIRHEITSLWTVADDIVITEMLVHYERLDGERLTLPCANVFRLRDGLIADYRIFMDISPVFA
jgi:ketosteroid isomerase-like protein